MSKPTKTDMWADQERRGSVMTKEEELAAESRPRLRKGGSILMGCAAQVGDAEETQRMLLEAEAVSSYFRGWGGDRVALLSENLAVTRFDEKETYAEAQAQTLESGPA